MEKERISGRQKEADDKIAEAQQKIEDAQKEVDDIETPGGSSRTAMTFQNIPVLVITQSD